MSDLGTEFGVEVNERGSTETRVFVGEVKMAPTSERGGVETEQRVLHAGQVARLEGQKLVLVAAPSRPTEEQFVRTMPTPQTTRAVDAYAALVLSLKPVVYYRMEPSQKEEHRAEVLDETGGGHDGVLSFSDEYVGKPYAAGRFGRSLRFRGLPAGDHVIVPDYPKATNDRLTVSAWVKAMGRSRTSWPMIAANWGRGHPDGSKHTGQFHFGLFYEDGDLGARITQRNGQWSEVREGASRPLPQGVWQHVALVIDGSVAHLYRNGLEVAAHPVAGILPQPPMASLGIGCRTNSAGTEVEWKDPNLWLGWIDELAIFNHALSPTEIQRLCVAVRHPTGVDPYASKVGGEKRTEERRIAPTSTE